MDDADTGTAPKRRQIAGTGVLTAAVAWALISIRLRMGSSESVEAAVYTSLQPACILYKKTMLLKGQNVENGLAKELAEQKTHDLGRGSKACKADTKATAECR